MYYKANLKDAFDTPIGFRGNKESLEFVTEDGFQIIRFQRNEATEFGTQGDIQIWCGSPTEEELRRLRTDPGFDDISCYLWGFQPSLSFYTCPTIHPSIELLTLYIYRSDWSMSLQSTVFQITYQCKYEDWQNTIGKEDYYVVDLNDSEFHQFMFNHLQSQLKLIPLKDNEIVKYLDETYVAD